MTLTSDQRWLLATMGGWPIVWALCDPSGTKHLMESHWGGSRLAAIEGAPKWMVSFGMDRGKVVSPNFQKPRVILSPAQINRYAEQLPEDVKAELKACRAAGIAETQRARQWCRCGREALCHKSNAGDPLYGNRHHPSDAEDEAHLVEVWRIRDWEAAVLARALRLDGEPVEQLDLFAEVGA
jgi:hypothetical protein